MKVVLMDKILVRGGNPISGKIQVAGAKNACLALMPLTILTSNNLLLRNVPQLSDVVTMKQLLISLGSLISHDEKMGTMSISSKELS